jgi:ATP-dependent helicase HrpA
MEEKLRRRDVLADVKTLDAFYVARLAGIFDLRGLKERLKKRGGDEFLRMSEADAVRVFPDPAELALYPDEIAAGGRAHRAVYKFAPGEDDDGLTLVVPMDDVARLSADALEWGVPGHLREKLAALVQGLPKRYRKQFVPVADAVEILLADIRPSDGPLFEALTRIAKRRFRAEVPPDAWAEVDQPRHLMMRVALVDPHGKELAAGRDLEVLRRIRKEAALTAARDPVVWERGRRQWERTGLTGWDFGNVPEVVSIGPGAAAYPGLEPAEGGANLRLFASSWEALESHKRGVEALLLLRFAKDFGFMERRLILPAEYLKTALYFGGAAAVEKMLAESLRADVFRKDIRSAEDFKSYGETVVRLLFERAHALWEAARAVLDAHARVRADLAAIGKAKASNKPLAAILVGIRNDVERLVPKDFLAAYPMARLAALARYLEACRLRADRAQHGPDKDRKKAEQAAVFVKALDRRLAALGPGTPPEIRQAVEEFRWMVEEFKVSLFAPELKTAFPISPKRLTEKLKEIESLGEDLPAKLRGGGAPIR